MITYNNERSVFNYNTLNEGIIFYSYRIDVCCTLCHQERLYRVENC